MVHYNIHFEFKIILVYSKDDRAHKDNHDYYYSISSLFEFQLKEFIIKFLLFIDWE